MENTNGVGVDTHKDIPACYTNNKFKEFETLLPRYRSKELVIILCYW